MQNSNGKLEYYAGNARARCQLLGLATSTASNVTHCHFQRKMEETKLCNVASLIKPKTMAITRGSPHVCHTGNHVDTPPRPCVFYALPTEQSISKANLHSTEATDTHTHLHKDLTPLEYWLVLHLSTTRQLSAPPIPLWHAQCLKIEMLRQPHWL